MVALSIPMPTVAAIDAHYEAHQEARQPQRLTARMLAAECHRQSWYAFRWAHEPKRFPGPILRSNLARQDGMNELAQCLSDIGIKVERVDPQTYMQMEVVAVDGHYRQKVAGKVTGVLEAPKKQHLLYTDQLPAKAFAQLQKHGLEVARPERMPAIQLGMHFLGLTRAFYLAKCKDTDELYSERIEYDPAHALALIAKAERIRDAHVPPARLSDDPEFWQCRFCPAHTLCHGGGFALRTCRSCLHSTPVPDGWRCERHNRDLSVEDQQAGCPNHLYLPGLVPGIPDDADEAAETVTYHLHDGKVWVDGEGRAS